VDFPVIPTLASRFVPQGRFCDPIFFVNLIVKHDGGETTLHGFGRSGTAFQSALGKIDFLAAFGALVRPVELVGEDFLFGAALRALATEGFKVFEIGKTWTMLRCRGHDNLLSVRLGSVSRIPSSRPLDGHSPGPFGYRLQVRWI
jgi:hypothetical protein